jgi:hypothetical protein
VDTLRLRSLGYKTEALIRNEYIFALDHLNSGSLAKCGGIVVTGHSGIGMNLSLITVILRTAMSGISVSGNKRDALIVQTTSLE